MSLASGTRLGPYEIIAPLGAGGMGEVYRAKDTKLGRDVAIKILLDGLARDPERMSRFEREARVLAALDHPNIAPIFGLEDSGDVRAIVMALIEGPTLADRIAAGPIPVEAATRIARQIIEALEYAHDRGVIHRDLKPANIKTTQDDAVKVLDFGLAKVLDDDATQSSSVANSPTLTLGHTRAGVILGTAAYMSPEQAVGKAADRRSDIFSFGAVLYEMLTGQRAFSGETAGETLVSVAKDEPDWSKLPPALPAAMQKLLRRCLVKDRRQRLQAIGEARIILDEPEPEPTAGAPVSPHPHRRSWFWPCTAAFLLLALMPANILHLRETPPVPPVLRYTISLPESALWHSFAISPDGRYLVVAAAVSGKLQLWLRALDALQMQPIPFTEEGTYPFWSPDSRWIGFFAQGKLKKVAVSGGPAQSLCDAVSGRGGSWNRDDVIVFAPNGAGGISIQKVSAGGGVPVNVTKNRGDQRHPVFLPDGRHFLYLIRDSPENSGIFVSALDGSDNRRILGDVSGFTFSPSYHGGAVGDILFVRENTLMALPFDAGSARSAGDVFPVADGVSLATNGSYAPATVSDSGILLFANGASVAAAYQIGWYDRGGKSLGLALAPGILGTPAISPDEKSIAFLRTPGNTSIIDLWVRDLTRGAETRLTSNSSINIAPFWSPKGERIVFSSNRTSGTFTLFQKTTNGSGQDEPLLPANTSSGTPTQWSHDGHFIVYFTVDPKTKSDLWVLPVADPANQQNPSERKPIPFLQTEFNELFGRLSPDSHWMAYTSDQSGRREVYVRPFPPGEGQWTISVSGGEQPIWKGDGKELYFIAGDGKMMAVPILKASAGPKPDFQAGTPVALFDGHVAPSPNNNVYMYDVTADGKKFLIDSPGGAGAGTAEPLNVVVNWNSGK